MREKILQLLESEGDLPPLPDIVIRIHDMVKRIDTNVRDIVKVIEMDPVLAGNILKLSNSVYYTRSSIQIKTLPVAITKIGLNALVKLVYALKLCPLFTDNPFISNKRFWTHSLAVAILTQSLSVKIHSTQEQHDISYLAGLMHDVGIMVLAYLIPLEYYKLLTELMDLDESLVSRERTLLGIDHAEVGSIYVDKWWRVEPMISKTVLYHHYMIEVVKEEQKSMRIVYAANEICNSQKLTNGITSQHMSNIESVLNEIGFDIQDMDSIIEEVNSSVDQAKELIYLQ
ncbi:HDOD domain-containing protein [Candidatus Latescibacterota bacterium]